MRKRKTDPQKIFAQMDRRVEETHGLTVRQSSILLEAVRQGYYEMPRRSKVRDIARHFGIARSTAEEHLRAAESAMIRSSAPLVAAREQLRSRTESPSEGHLFEELARMGTELDVLLQLALRDNTIDRLDAHPERHPRTHSKGEPDVAGSLWNVGFIRPGSPFLSDECDELIDST